MDNFFAEYNRCLDCGEEIEDSEKWCEECQKYNFVCPECGEDTENEFSVVLKDKRRICKICFEDNKNIYEVESNG